MAVEEEAACVIPSESANEIGAAGKDVPPLELWAQRFEMLRQKGLNVGLAVQPIAGLKFRVDRGNADHLTG
jgi:hypothetical protein